MSGKSASRGNGSEIRVGSRVRYPMPGGSSFLLEVIEDRGNVGWRGRHILRVRRISEYPEEREDFEVRAEDVTLED